MYCPKCNQQQASEEMRFCSRCGFPLAGVAELLANNGLPLEPVNQKPAIGSRRRKIISESAFLTLVAWAVALAAMLLVDYGGPLELVARIFAITFFIIGVIGVFRFIYGFLLVGDSPTTKEQPDERALKSKVKRAELPPPQSISAGDYLRGNTKEMVPQPSVTENTTRLLDERFRDQGD